MGIFRRNSIRISGEVSEEFQKKMPEYPEENQEKFKRNFRENSRGILEKNLFFFQEKFQWINSKTISGKII